MGKRRYPSGRQDRQGNGKTENKMNVLVITVLFGFASASCATASGVGVNAGADSKQTKQNGAVPAELRGTWVGQTGDISGSVFTFTADTYSFINSKGYFKAGNLKFRRTVNRNRFTREDYPSGYVISAVQSTGSGSYSGFIGNEYTEDPIFFNLEKTKFNYGGGDWIFAKKQ